MDVQSAPSLALCVSALLLLGIGCSSGPPASPELGTLAAPVVDGMLAATCQWPTALSVNGCTATLVHPKLVTLAAHCLEGNALPDEVRFGENDSRPERRVSIETCKSYPGFVVGRTDVAYCTLTSEVRDIPPTPIIMGCETDFLQVGSSLTLVGFGLTGATANGTSGQKRWADVVIQRFVSSGPSIEVGMGTVTSCLGDSGGPLYAKLSDGTFRVVGAGSLTRLIGGECVPPAYYILLHRFVDWMETSSGLDLTPCHDTDGMWHPGPNCGGFATAADRPNGTWAEGCNAGATSSANGACGPSIDGGTDALLDRDDAPTTAVGGPSEPAGCTCRISAGTAGPGRPSGAGGARDFWLLALAFGGIGWLRRRLRPNASAPMPCASSSIADKFS